MPWRYLAIRYAWDATVYHALLTRRWTDDQKAVALSAAGALLSVPFVAAQVLWILTGRGPIQWLYRPDVAHVNPFPRWQHPDVAGAWERTVGSPGRLPILRPPEQTGDQR